MDKLRIYTSVYKYLIQSKFSNPAHTCSDQRTTNHGRQPLPFPLPLPPSLCLSMSLNPPLLLLLLLHLLLPPKKDLNPHLHPSPLDLRPPPSPPPLLHSLPAHIHIPGHQSRSILRLARPLRIRRATPPRLQPHLPARNILPPRLPTLAIPIRTSR